MTLWQVIDNLKTLSRTVALVNSTLPDVILEQVDVYLDDGLSVNSEVNLLDAETIDNRLEIEINGKRLVNLFPLYMAQEMVEGYVNSGEALSDVDMAQKLIDFRIKDA